MPPRTAQETDLHRTNNLIGLFAVSVFFFFVTWLLGRTSSHAATPLLLWFFGLLGAASLVGWLLMAYRRLAR